MYKSFKDINDRSMIYLRNIQNGIEPQENFNLLLFEFKPIIKKIVGSIKHNGYIETDDLEQEAMITLWKCCDKYNFDNNSSFYSYFYSSALNSLHKYVYMYQTPITMNNHEKERTKQLITFAKEYYNINGYYPNVDDYVSAGFSKKISNRFHDYLTNMLYYGQYNTEYDNIKYNTLTEDDCDKTEENEMLFSAVLDLDDKYKKIIEMRYIENLTYKEMAKILGVSETTARKYEMKAIEILKNSLKDLI